MSDLALRTKLVRLASSLPKGSEDRRALLTVIKEAAKEPAKLKGKKLDAAINTAFKTHGDRVEFNIMDLSKMSNEVKAAYEAGGDIDEAMKKAVAKYRRN